MSISKTSKMLNFINYRMRVTIQDSRQLVGTFMAFDKHMNLVLGDCEEFRKVQNKKASGARIEKRTLGLVLLRGETIVSMQIEAPPPQKHSKQQSSTSTSNRNNNTNNNNVGVARAQGRGMPIAPLSSAPQGLQGPIRGVGNAFNSSNMQPQQAVAQVAQMAAAAQAAQMAQIMAQGGPRLNNNNNNNNNNGNNDNNNNNSNNNAAPMGMVPPMGRGMGRGMPPPGSQGPPGTFGRGQFRQ